MAQLVEALCYKPEGHGFDSWWCHWNFSFNIILLAALWPSNRNEYQEYFLEGKGGRCVGLTTLPPSCTDCLEIWEPQPPGTLRACPGLSWDCFTWLCPFLYRLFCAKLESFMNHFEYNETLCHVSDVHVAMRVLMFQYTVRYWTVSVLVNHHHTYCHLL